MAEQDNKAMQATVDALIDLANEIADEKDELQERVKANRDTLRNFKKMGVTTAAQNKDIDELYPPRESKDDKTETPAAS